MAINSMGLSWSDEEIEQAYRESNPFFLGYAERGGSAQRRAEEENKMKLKAIISSEREYTVIKNVLIKTNATVKTCLDAYCLGISVDKIQEIAMRNPKLADEALQRDNILEPFRASDIKRFSDSLTNIQSMKKTFTPERSSLKPRQKKRPKHSKAKRKQQKLSRRRNRT